MQARVITLLSAFAPSASRANLIVSQNGKSGYTILIAAEASPSERQAVEELRTFVEQISGARIPISMEPHPRMVLVGNSLALGAIKLDIPFRELGPEGFILKPRALTQLRALTAPRFR